MSVNPSLDWGKKHVAREAPLDPGYCVCGVSLDAPEHIPAPPKVDSQSYIRRKRIKDFINRHGVWKGQDRTLLTRQKKEVTYTEEAVDSIADGELEQEMIDILYLHADTGRCRGCSDEIFWMRKDGGKAVPYSRDGQVHFATCSARDRFKKGA